MKKFAGESSIPEIPDNDVAYDDDDDDDDDDNGDNADDALHLRFCLCGHFYF